jgi:hypothetical protein
MMRKRSGVTRTSDNSESGVTKFLLPAALVERHGEIENISIFIVNKGYMVKFVVEKSQKR